MSVICVHCEGWGCLHCKTERKAAAGGEQGLSPLEIEVAELRTDRDAWHRRALGAEDQRDAAERLVIDQRELLLDLKTERDGLLAQVALLRIPRGAA